MKVTLFKVLTLVSQRSTDGFWKSVAKNVPREPSDMRILNPYFIQEASFKLIGLPHNNGQMGRGVSDMFSSAPCKKVAGMVSCLMVRSRLHCEHTAAATQSLKTMWHYK